MRTHINQRLKRITLAFSVVIDETATFDYFQLILVHLLITKKRLQHSHGLQKAQAYLIKEVKKKNSTCCQF